MQIVLILLAVIAILLFWLIKSLPVNQKQVLLNKTKKTKKKKPFSIKKIPKTDEELFIAKEETISNTERKKRKLQNQQQNDFNLPEEKIVGIVKPQGYWTNKIFGERFGTILAMSKQNKSGFWTTLVELNRSNSTRSNSNRNKTR
jgi:membrane-associated HD superfamily phosphohydrolase